MLKLIDFNGVSLVEVEQTDKGTYYRGIDWRYDNIPCPENGKDGR